MKALFGRENVLEWAGTNMTDGLLECVDREHAELGTASKCRSTLEDFKCCRVRGHEGIHFSRTWDRRFGQVQGKRVITGVWTNG